MNQKKEFGQAINTLKNAAQEKVNSLKVAIDATEETSGVYGDLSRPGAPITLGSRHPISIVKTRLQVFFLILGLMLVRVQKLKMTGIILPL